MFNRKKRNGEKKHFCFFFPYYYSQIEIVAYVNKVVLGLKTKLKQIGSEFGMGCKTIRYDNSCSSGRLSKKKVN